MAKYILFTGGLLSARYDSDINNIIPDGAVEVTDELFFQTINETDGLWTNDDISGIIKNPFPPPTAQEVVSGYMGVVQSHMDGKAVEYGYDNLLSVVSYADEPIVGKYQNEGKGFREWRSLCWAYCEQVQTDVAAETRTAPTYEELILELPELIIPS